MNFIQYSLRLAVVAHLLLGADSGMGQQGREVVVICNRRLPESVDLAAYYAQRRAVPTHQIFSFDLPESESMTRQAYLKHLQEPLLQRLQTSGIWPANGAAPDAIRPAVAGSSVRYLLVCYGVPYRIAEDKGFKEKGLPDLRQELRRTEASVDSQLAALPVRPTEARWMGPLRNPVLGATNASRLHPLSGILMVTRLDGPSAQAARGLVDRAMEAETNGWWGRAYFDARGLTNHPAMQLGDDWIRAAERICRLWGFQTELDLKEATYTKGKALSDVAVYAGWYSSIVSGPWELPAVDFRPGAIAYHLHSFSAQNLRSPDLNWVGPLVRRGVTATMGYVAEPYLATTTDLSIFFSRLTFGRFSFGEAVWAAQNSLSWQTVAVGDPLYRPCKLDPRALHAALDKTSNPAAVWSHLLVVNRAQAMNTPVDRLVTYLERLAFTRSSAVLTEKLGDLYWEKKKFRDALSYYDLALERNPTAQQRLRLLLRLGHLRRYYGPERKALEYFQQVLRDFPGYPEPLSVYEQMLALGKSLEKSEVVALCEKEIARLKGSR